jgi:hypothetical protein
VRRKAAEKAIALGEVDHFPFILARDLGISLDEVDAMPFEQFVRWKAFYVWERAMQKFVADGGKL